MDHDQGYKRLFSEPALVADLLRGYVREPWVAELDFATLERLGTSFVTADLRTREADLIWRVRFREEWLYLYLLLEFQSRADPFMAVRMLVYEGLLYQDLIRSGQVGPQRRLPPVLPLVLYNGEPRWRAATDIGALIGPLPAGLERWRPRLPYLVLDEMRLAEGDGMLPRNLAAALFRLEASRGPEDLRQVLDALVDWLADPAAAGVRQAFLVWLRRVLLPGRLPAVDFGQVSELEEMRDMLAQRVQDWTREWKEQGLREGRAEGRAEGLAQGRRAGGAALLERQLEHRFGPLDLETLERLAQADAEQLLVWGERLLAAESLDELFSDP
jgi:predicted transposase YdaD